MGDGIHGSAPVSRVARGGVTAFFVYGAGFGLTYCSQLVIARVVGVDTYGVYAYVFAWMVVLAYFSALGFDVGLLRFVPAYEAERAWPLLQGVIQYAQRRAAFVGLSVIFIGICVVNAWGSSPELQSTFLAGFALVPIFALVRIRCSAVRAFGGVVSALVPDRVVRDGTLIGLLAVASLGLGWTLNAPFVMVATLISSALGLVCAGVAMRHRRPRAIDHILPAYDAAVWRRAAIQRQGDDAGPHHQGCVMDVLCGNLHRGRALYPRRTPSCVVRCRLRGWRARAAYSSHQPSDGCQRRFPIVRHDYDRA